uniref:Brain protein I3 n=1 Tax=Ascaris lumbricoides TaxID=6252 RepID=A0A0M3HSL9_ASCLU
MRAAVGTVKQRNEEEAQEAAVKWKWFQVEKEMDTSKNDPPPPYEQNIGTSSAPLPSNTTVIYVEQQAYVPCRYDQPNVIVVSIPRCPKCQSANLHYHYPCATLAALVLLAIIFFPTGLCRKVRSLELLGFRAAGKQRQRAAGQTKRSLKVEITKREEDGVVVEEMGQTVEKQQEI